MKNQFKFKDYTRDQKEACLKIFDSNVPKFFSAHEKIAYSEFLDQQTTKSYWVMYLNDTAIGCGGVALESDNCYSLCYGLISQSYHRQGAGSELIKFRLGKILSKPGVRKIRLDTMQINPGFFEKFGFKIEYQKKDFYGAGIDKVEMVLHIKSN